MIFITLTWRLHDIAKHLRKMYSDTILASDPRSNIITVSDSTDSQSRNRAEIWRQAAPASAPKSLAERVGFAQQQQRRGRGGQIGGGSFHDMFVD
jgi:hypothetical protein